MKIYKNTDLCLNIKLKAKDGTLITVEDCKAIEYTFYTSPSGYKFKAGYKNGIYTNIKDGKIYIQNNDIQRFNEGQLKYDVVISFLNPDFDYDNTQDIYESKETDIFLKNSPVA